MRTAVCLHVYGLESVPQLFSPWVGNQEVDVRGCDQAVPAGDYGGGGEASFTLAYSRSIIALSLVATFRQSGGERWVIGVPRCCVGHGRDVNTISCERSLRMCRDERRQRPTPRLWCRFAPLPRSLISKRHNQLVLTPLSTRGGLNPSRSGNPPPPRSRKWHF